MNKQQLLKLRKLNKEAEILRQELKNVEFRSKEYVSDVAKDYSTGYPITIKIEGYGSEEYIKVKQRLYNRLNHKLTAIHEEQEQLEKYLDSIEDPELRAILRLRYVDGMTQEQIAEEMGYSIATIKRRLSEITKVEPQ